MSVWAHWLRQPQTLWIRRAVLQVHLWTGLALGVYVLVISLSGSVLVFRDELNSLSSPGPQPGRPATTDVPLTSWLLDLHDDLLSGTTGRRTNAVGALLTLLAGVTGAVVWWPGIRNWRRSLTIDTRAAWKSLFDYYVFGEPAAPRAHLPAHAQGPLGTLDEMLARRLRALVLRKLQR